MKGVHDKKCFALEIWPLSNFKLAIDGATQRRLMPPGIRLLPVNHENWITLKHGTKGMGHTFRSFGDRDLGLVGGTFQRPIGSLFLHPWSTLLILQQWARQDSMVCCVTDCRPNSSLCIRSCELNFASSDTHIKRRSFSSSFVMLTRCKMKSSLFHVLHLKMNKKDILNIKWTSCHTLDFFSTSTCLQPNYRLFVVDGVLWRKQNKNTNNSETGSIQKNSDTSGNNKKMTNQKKKEEEKEEEEEKEGEEEKE